MGKHPDNYFKYAFPYEVCANVLESSKYGDEFVGISDLYVHTCLIAINIYILTAFWVQPATREGGVYIQIVWERGPPEVSKYSWTPSHA